MKLTSRNADQTQIKHIHHDTSLSAFATGLFIGTLATLVLATEEGRSAGKKLLNALKETSQDLSPEIEKIAEIIKNTVREVSDVANQNPFNPLERLHRGAPPSNTSFTKEGKPLI